MHTHFILSRTAAACALALPLVVTAQDSTLPTVVITARDDSGGLHSAAGTGSNLDLSRFDTPASVDAITRQQLEQRGDRSLVDAITRAPGVSAMPHPGNAARRWPRAALPTPCRSCACTTACASTVAPG